MKYFLFYHPVYALVRSTSSAGASRWYGKSFSVAIDDEVEMVRVSKTFAANELNLFSGLGEECVKEVMQSRRCGILLKQTELPLHFCDDLKRANKKEVGI